MISLKQSPFYTLPALPFLSIGLALLILPRVRYLVNQIGEHSIGFKVFKGLSFALAAATIWICVASFNEVGREKEVIRDVRRVMELLPKNTIITIPPELVNHGVYAGYFYRYEYISLERIPGREYALTEKTFEADFIPEYERMDIDLEFFDLYRKKELD